MRKKCDLVETRDYEELKADFDKYYNSVIYPFLQGSEQLRLKLVRRFWFSCLLSLVIVPMIIILCVLYADCNFYMIAFTLISAAYYCAVPYMEYRETIKESAMHLIVKFFDGFMYHPHRGFSLQDLDSTRIFPEYSRIFSERREVIHDDCFSGVYNGVIISVCEERFNREYYNAKGTICWKTLFRGIAVKLDMNKKFSGQTIVVENAGIFNAFKKYKGLERVKLEDVVFEKQFEVYSTNQVEARYILTTSFMDRLLKLRELYKGKKIQASFYKNKLLIAINTKKNMFEPCAFFKTNLNKQRVDLVFEQIWTIFSIINTLKLNVKMGL